MQNLSLTSRFQYIDGYINTIGRFSFRRYKDFSGNFDGKVFPSIARKKPRYLKVLVPRNFENKSESCYLDYFISWAKNQPKILGRLIESIYTSELDSFGHGIIFETFFKGLDRYHHPCSSYTQDAK